MTGMELVQRNAGVTQATNASLSIEESKQAALAALREMKEPADVKEIHDQATTYEAYAQAKGSREAYFAAAEVRLWAERRAGEMRAALPRLDGGGTRPRLFDYSQAKEMRASGATQREVAAKLGISLSTLSGVEQQGWPEEACKPRSELAAFADEFGITAQRAADWEHAAEITLDRFAELIEEAQRNDSALTLHALLARDGRTHAVCVERGIYRRKDGRLFLRWKRDGRSVSKTLNHSDLERARKSLAKARGRIPTPRPTRKTVADAHSYLRGALNTLDAALPKASPDVRKAINDALAHGHKCEDAIIRALNAERGSN